MVRIKKFFERIMWITICIVIIGSYTTRVLADDGEENDNENENIISEIKTQKYGNTIQSSNSENQKPIINSRKYTVLDRKSGLAIYGNNENKQTAMASTTKIMTRNCCD